jgi:hypothetical protein
VQFTTAREGKGREEKRREDNGREGKGREGKKREGKSSLILLFDSIQAELLAACIFCGFMYDVVNSCTM